MTSCRGRTGVRAVGAVAALGLGLTACGGGGAGDDDTAAEGPATATSTPAEAPADGTDEGGPGLLEPVWMYDDIAGSVRALDVADGQMFVASSLPSGYLLWRGDLESGGTDWLLEDVTPDVDQVVADGEGGVVTVHGNELRSYDAEGRENWSTVPLRAREGGASAGIESVAVEGDAVLVGGDGYGSAAEVSLTDGAVRWFLLQDETVTPDARFLGAGESVAFVGNDVALLAGGDSVNYTVVAVDRSSAEILWTRQTSVPPRALLAGETLLLRPSATSLASVDPATGRDRWVIEEPDWDRDPLTGQPRVAGDVVITQNIRQVTGFDLSTGEERWVTEDRAQMLLQSSPDPYGDRIVGFVEQNITLGLQAPDGTVSSAPFWDGGPVGTIELLAVAGDRALVAARASTNQQPSQMWLLDLTELS